MQFKCSALKLHHGNMAAGFFMVSFGFFVATGAKQPKIFDGMKRIFHGARVDFS